MSYFIFTKNLDNIDGTIFKIAENQFDLNNLIINQNDYKIIEDSQLNFNLVKLGDKFIQKYNNNVISYVDETVVFQNKQQLQNYLNYFKDKIKQFTDNNPSHPLLTRWDNYYNQLNNFNLDSITYPLNKSLQKHFNDLGQPSYSILQLP